ncbi:unnamed protein product [Lymnaea stagnalis]|uniref:Voltage-gated hydrogen channel 1 n=1 Tax=Lymnaea stagnalis TaxID=6523 RepID=A0AAV2HSC9_LYMST
MLRIFKRSKVVTITAKSNAMSSPDVYTISPLTIGGFQKGDDLQPCTSPTRGGILKGFPQASNGRISGNPNGHVTGDHGKSGGLEAHGAKHVRHSIVSIASSTFESLAPPEDLTTIKRCQRRLSVLLHTHVLLIVVSTLAALDAVCVIGQLICDILIMREKLDYYEVLDETLTEHLFDHIPGLNKTLHGKWNLDAILDVLRGDDVHFTSYPLSTPPRAPALRSLVENATLSTVTATVSAAVEAVFAGEDPVTGHRSKRAIEPKVPGHEVDHGLRYTMTHIFHLGSLVILSALLLETFLKIFAMGTKLKHHKLEVFDAIVVAVSWCLDVAFWEGIWAHPGTEAAMILIYLLPWRVVRIVNSFVLVIQEKDHVELKIVKQRLRQSVKKNKESLEKTSMYKHELKALAGLCRKLGASDSEITACSPIGKAVRRGSLHSVLERAASLTLISTMSSMGSVPSLFDMGDISSDDEDSSHQHDDLGRKASQDPTVKSAFSSTTIDSIDEVFTFEKGRLYGVENNGYGGRSHSVSSKDSTAIQIDPPADQAEGEKQEFTATENNNTATKTTDTAAENTDTATENTDKATEVTATTAHLPATRTNSDTRL